MKNSAGRITASATMTAMKLIALSAKHVPTPTDAISTPAIAGPMTRVALLRLELSAIALGSSDRPTSWIIIAWRVGLLNAMIVPRTSAIASMTRMLSTCR